MRKLTRKDEQNLLDRAYWYIHIIDVMESRHVFYNDLIWNYCSQASRCNLLTDYHYGLHSNIWCIFDSVVDFEKKHKTIAREISDFINDNRNEHFHLFKPSKSSYTVEKLKDIYEKICKNLNLSYITGMGDWLYINAKKTKTRINEPDWVILTFKQIDNLAQFTLKKLKLD